MLNINRIIALNAMCPGVYGIDSYLNRISYTIETSDAEWTKQTIIGRVQEQRNNFKMLICNELKGGDHA